MIHSHPNQHVRSTLRIIAFFPPYLRTNSLLLITKTKKEFLIFDSCSRAGTKTQFSPAIPQDCLCRSCWGHSHLRHLDKNTFIRDHPTKISAQEVDRMKACIIAYEDDLRAKTDLMGQLEQLFCFLSHDENLSKMFITGAQSLPKISFISSLWLSFVTWSAEKRATKMQVTGMNHAVSKCESTISTTIITTQVITASMLWAMAEQVTTEQVGRATTE